MKAQYLVVLGVAALLTLAYGVSISQLSSRDAPGLQLSRPPQDPFTFSITPSIPTVTHGGSTSVVILIASRSATKLDVGFAPLSEPSAVSISFSQQDCSLGPSQTCTVTMLITAGIDAPTGDQIVSWSMGNMTAHTLVLVG